MLSLIFVLISSTQAIYRGFLFPRSKHQGVGQQVGRGVRRRTFCAGVHCATQPYVSPPNRGVSRFAKNKETGERRKSVRSYCVPTSIPVTSK